MKRVVFKTANSIGHEEYPDGYEPKPDMLLNQESNENVIEPLLPAGLRPRTVKNDNEETFPQRKHANGVEPLLPNFYPDKSKDHDKNG